MINILLLNWNSGLQTEVAVKNIVNSNYRNLRIILIDNGSVEKDIIYLNNSKKLAESNNIPVFLIYNRLNQGYTGGNNVGFNFLQNENLDGDILILNPDVIINFDTIKEMKNALSNSNVGGVMVRTISKNGEILYDFLQIKGLHQKWFKGNDNDILQTDYLAGSCMLLKRDALNKIGLFDDSFFLYWEEVDLSFRLMKSGYSIVSTTFTAIIRDSNDESRKSNSVFYLVRNSFLMYKKHNFISKLDLFKYLIRNFAISIKNSVFKLNLSFIYNYFIGLYAGISKTLKL